MNCDELKAQMMKCVDEKQGTHQCKEIVEMWENECNKKGKGWFSFGCDKKDDDSNKKE